MMTFLETLLIHQKKLLSSIKKRECLRSAIDKGKAHLLRHKWTYERGDKASDKTINKTLAEYRQRERNKNGERS